MNTRTACIALGKAVCILIEPTHDAVAEYSDNSRSIIAVVHGFSFETYVNDNKREPKAFILSDNSYAELGLIYLEFLKTPYADIDCSNDLLSDIRPHIHMPHTTLASLKAKLRTFIAKTILDLHHDLIFSNACDLLLLPAPENSYRDKMIKIINDEAAAKVKFGNIMKTMHSDRSDKIRKENPSAWAVTYSIEYRTQVIFSEFYDAFLEYDIKLTDYFDRYEPMTYQQIKEGAADTLYLEQAATWSMLDTTLRRAVEQHDLVQILTITQGMEAHRDTRLYASYHEVRTSVRSYVDYKLFAKNTRFFINPLVQKEYDEIVTPSRTPQKK